MRKFCLNKPEQCCCTSTEQCCPEFFAQFGVQANPASGSALPFTTVFQKGAEIDLDGNAGIKLAPGYLYSIDYIFLATPEAEGYMEIVPYINGSPRLLYAFFAPAGRERNTSASGSFTTNEAALVEAVLSFKLTYPSATRNIDISGTISVTPVMKI